MAQRLPPPPTHGTADDKIPDVWANWLLRLRDYVSTTTSAIAWSVIDKTGSSLSDIVSRSHSLLSSVQGGNSTEQYHLTAAQHTDLTDAGDSTLHYHATDRARANHTGTQTLATISDAGTAAAKNTGTSGNTVPLLDGTNTWSGSQTWSTSCAVGTVATQFSLRVNKTVTGNVISTGVGSTGEIQSDVTSGAFLFNSSPTVVAATFTLSDMFHFRANQGTIGAGATVTNQVGFVATATLTGATNNYGFYGNIASATGRWNFYANGTAANHFTGATTFGTSFGYGTTSGVGGTVTQLTSKATGVTINKICGNIVTHNAALAAATNVGFTITNSTVAATDTIIIHRASGGTAGAYQVWADSVAAGSFVVYLRNTTAGSLSEAVTLNFSVIKATNV